MSALKIGERIDTIPAQIRLRRYSPADNSRPRRGLVTRADLSDSSTPSSTSSDVKPTVSPEVTSTTEEPNRKGKTNSTDPPNGSGTTTSKTDPNTGINNASKNSQTTLGLFATTIFLGLASIGTHCTNIFGEGSTKNLLAFGADCATTFTGALTLSSLLAPISKDSSGIHHM